MRQVRNFLLLPTTITLLRKGISLLILSSMGTGGIFSPSDVVITSRGDGKWGEWEDGNSKRYIGRKVGRKKCD